MLDGKKTLNMIKENTIDILKGKEAFSVAKRKLDSLVVKGLYNSILNRIIDNLELFLINTLTNEHSEIDLELNELIKGDRINCVEFRLRITCYKSPCSSDELINIAKGYLFENRISRSNELELLAIDPKQNINFLLHTLNHADKESIDLRTGSARELITKVRKPAHEIVSFLTSNPLIKVKKPNSNSSLIRFCITDKYN